MSKALVPYRPRSLAAREIDRVLERRNSDIVPFIAGRLPKGDGDVGEAALHILRCCREAKTENDVPESTVVVELQTQTEVAAGELLETQKRGRVACRDEKWYFELVTFSFNLDPDLRR
jgi:hypothetical protein